MDSPNCMYCKRIPTNTKIFPWTKDGKPTGKVVCETCLNLKFAQGSISMDDWKSHRAGPEVEAAA